jgi:hypothetical protein
MARESSKAVINYELDNIQVNAPTEWQNIEILANFENESVQANITTDLFTFTLNEATKIRKFISNGMNGGVGIFEGMPFNLSVKNKDNQYNAFKGFLDLTDTFIDDVENNRVKCKVSKDNGLNSLEARLSAISFGWLENQKHITNADYKDIEYVVEKPLNLTEEILTAITLYIMIKELNDSIKESSKLIAETSAYIATGLTGGVAAAINLIAKITIQTVYMVVMLRTIVSIAESMFNRYIPPKRTTKALSFKTGLAKMFGFIGYTVVTNITDLDKYYFLPSNKKFDDVDNTTGLFKKVNGKEKGIPDIEDFGYRCIDFYTLVKRMFNTKIAIVKNEIYLYNEFDAYWLKTSTYQMPSILNMPFRYNTEEFVANKIVRFDTDLVDEWTVKNFTGTNYEVITDAITVINKNAKYLSGLEDIEIPLALGNRKDDLLYIEKILLQLAEAVDATTKILGGNTKYVAKIKSKIGLLKITSNNWSKPKVIVMNGDRMPVNHRSICSAKYLYDNYHYGKSFVVNNGYGQKIMYDEVRIPFAFEDFLKTIENSYFTNENTQIGKITSLKWNIAGDFAIVSYWIRKQYTKNLKETFIEP